MATGGSTTRSDIAQALSTLAGALGAQQPTANFVNFAQQPVNQLLTQQQQPATATSGGLQPQPSATPSRTPWPGSQ